MTGVQCFLGELPFNFVSGSVLKKLGHINVMSLVLLIYAIRWIIKFLLYIIDLYVAKNTDLIPQIYGI